MQKFIIFIYTSLPGYMYNCIEKLAAEIEYKIILVETDINLNYPVKFSSKNFDILNFTDFEALRSRLDNTDIVKIFVTGWANKTILKYANNFYKQKISMVLLSDQAKKNNLRQLFGKVLLKNYLNKFDKIIVPGKAGYDLMTYYGIHQNKIMPGLYTGNDRIFIESKNKRDTNTEYPRNFLFDGQFIERKAFPFLINEYLEYLNISKNPWKLTVVGKGHLESLIPKEIINLGFVKQFELKEVYANAGCFILPSLEDHWPLVIHQATMAGLPLLISQNCHNHYEFFRENENGYFINPNEKGSLTAAMFKIESLELEQIKVMGTLSFELSKMYSIDKWVQKFKNLINN